MFISKGNVPQDMIQKQNSVNSMYVAEESEEDYAIEGYIRQRYSMSKELALHRKQAMGILPEEEWNEYCEYVEECINKVREKDLTAE